MRNVYFIGLFGLIMTASVTAQQPTGRLNADEAEVVLIALEGFVAAPEKAGLRSKQARLVISGQTSDKRSSFPGISGLAKERVGRRQFAVSQEALEHIRAASGLQATTCDSISRLDYSLCGIPQPWVWLVPSVPAIEASRAVVEIEERWLEFGHEFALGRYEIVLTRMNDTWKIYEIRLVGES